MLDKYNGKIVEIIYLDKDNKISHRRVKVVSISNTTVRCFCLEKRAPRLFKNENILAVCLVSERRTG